MQNQAKCTDNSLENCLFKYCDEFETGTVLIATNNNKSCQITIEKGQIIAASMGRSKGLEVARILLDDGVRRASFTANMQFPHSVESHIRSSDQFLNILKNIPHLSLVPNTGSNISKTQSE